MKLGLISLGCDKNTVDSERILAALVGHGAERVSDPAQAEVVVVNTCAFIDAAKEESLETLLEAAALKDSAGVRAVVAVGCMVERYREELEEALPEVDLFVGLRDLDRLVPELRARGLLGDPLADHPGARLPLSERRHVAYLKVSEGCDHGCAFCAIPLWRGKHRSFPTERLVSEALRLEARGAVEVNLVAQDLAHFGRDFRDGTDISTLLRALLAETGIPWFRLLYIYSAGIREPLIELLAAEPRVLPYIDMPIQHASDPVLERMRRPERRERLRRKVEWLREAIPDLTLRTTVMVGFPGETDEDFRALLDFMEEARFDRLGAFAFSPQEGTRAAGLEELFVPEDVARARLEELLEVQRAVSAERMAAEVGRLREALVDRASASDDPRAFVGGRGPDDPGRPNGASSATGRGLGGRPETAPTPVAVGRIVSQAHDVDGETLLRLGVADGAGPSGLAPGTLVQARVVEAGDFDLVADVVRVLRAPDTVEPTRAVASPRHRSLPLAPLGLETAWGR